MQDWYFRNLIRDLLGQFNFNQHYGPILTNHIIAWSSVAVGAATAEMFTVFKVTRGQVMWGTEVTANWIFREFIHSEMV